MAILAALVAACGGLRAAEAPVDFAAKIAPIFHEHCNECHNESDADGGLVLESYEAVLKGGENGDAIKRGNAQDSPLVKFLEGRSGKEGKNKFMPPGKREHLAPDQIALIRTWIDAGAPAPAAPAKIADVLAKLPKIAARTDARKAIHALAFSPQARLIAAGSLGSVQILDAATGQPVRKIGDVAGKVNALVFSGDGAVLFGAAGEAGIGGVAYQWRVSDGALVRKFEGHRDTVYALALSPDGTQLATGSYEQKIKLWNTTDGRELRTIASHTGGVFGLDFRRDGKVLASASADRTVKLWDPATGKRLETFSQPLKEQSAAVFSPDGRTLAAAGADNRIRIWSVSDAATEGSNPVLFTRFAHEGAILSLAYSPDGKYLISAGADQAVKVWNAADLTELHPLEKQPDWSPGIVAVDAGKIAVGRADGALAFYDLASGKPMAATAAKPAKPATAKAMAPVKPEITRLDPAGIQSGATTRVLVTGKALAGIQTVKFSTPDVSAKVLGIDPQGATAELEINAGATIPRSQIDLTIATAAGAAAPAKLQVDYLQQVVIAKSAAPTRLATLPVNVWGTLNATGQQDNVTFTARKGETITLDLAAKRLDSKAKTPRLEIFDAGGKLLCASNGLDSGVDPFIAFTAPRDGDYTARVLEITLEGSPDHRYRLTVGALPYVTGWWPLSVPPERESTVHLVGHNLSTPSVTVKAGAAGTVTLPLDTDSYRSRVAMKVEVGTFPESLEVEPNDSPERAQAITLPASINGRLGGSDLAHDGPASDADVFAFAAEKGQSLVLETRAGMLGSPADTKIEVLDTHGEPVPQMLLQATKDSWLTLRSKDSREPAIRLGQFDEMELNDLMYFNGEVLKIYRLARGPDADMLYYARGGVRRTWFSTSPAAHGLDEPCYVVEPRPVGARITPNGLPVFTLNFANDDDGERELGRDSRLIFTAPTSGRYLVRVTDTRGWSGDRYAYRLIVRAPAPDFTVALAPAAAPTVPAGSGTQFLVRANRIDGFEGDIRVDIADVPPGLHIASPIMVEAGHLTATGVLFARPDAPAGAVDFSKVKITATAQLGGSAVTRTLAGFPSVNVTAAAQQAIFMEPDAGGKAAGDGRTAPAAPYEITIAPGDRVAAWLRVDRRAGDALVNLDVENLPHGVIVDSIGLNGVQIRAGEREREIFLSCAKWVREQDRLCHVVIGNARGTDSVEGAAASFPVLLKVRKPAGALTAK